MPPARPAANARSSAGKVLAVDRLERPRGGRGRSRRRAATGSSRSRPARAPSAIGSCMSGGLAWAIVAPSVKVTIECTTDCGWTTTSIRSYGMPNSRCASITSRPLLTSVAELMVTTGPMSQVGWASACAGGDVGHLRGRAAAERAAGGGDDQGATSRSAPDAQALGERAVLGVDRARSARARGAGDQRAAGDQRLLVGQRQRAARPQRGQRRLEADRAGDPVEHDVRVDALHQSRRRPTCPRRPPRRDARAAAAAKQFGAPAAGPEADDLEPVRVRADHVERLGADRPGGAEQDHAAPAGRLPRGRHDGHCPPPHLPARGAD